MAIPTIEEIVSTTMHNRATLRRVSAYFRTVRYEHKSRYGGGVFYGPTFPATILEWERACD